MTVTAVKPKFAYVANNYFTPGSVSQFSISATTGALTALATPTVAAGMKPFSVAVDATGKYAYVVNFGDAVAANSTVSQYSIDAATGALAPMTPAAVVTGLNPLSITVAPNGKSAYVVLSGGNVAQFAIGATGGLTPLTPATLATGATPSNVTIDPTGKFAYVANGDGTISQYTVSSVTGALTAAGSVAVTGAAPYGITIDPSGKFAYTTGGTEVAQFSINATTGALAPLATPTVPSRGNSAYAISIDPTSKFAYVVNANLGATPAVGKSTLSAYAIDATGALTAIGATAIVLPDASTPDGVSVDSTGKYLYVVTRNVDDVLQYSIGVTGALTALAPASVAGPAGAGASAVVTTK
jgi:6-phosphogluconolactonase